VLMSEQTGEIWFDGEFVPWQDAKVHVLTHTLHYGLGVFEGVRAYATDKGAAIFRLEEHTDRLFNSAHILGMDMPWSKNELMDVQLQAVKINKLDSAYIRPMCFYGDEGMGLRADNLQTHIIVAAWSWPSYMDADALETGIRVKTSSLTQLHVNTNMCKAKANGHYINSILALREATNDGYDEALLLDHQGYVSEGSGENIFMVKDGAVHTPLLGSCLDGITRKSLITLSQDLGFEVIERPITRDELYIADEAFFSGTAAEVIPIRELDNRMIGNGVRGEITTALQTLYHDAVTGKENKYAKWLTYTNSKKELA
jgi:branched-chain amino acid aminotransferase